jgi:3-oxoacyl-[acyl-carrier-protein] synthase-3
VRLDDTFIAGLGSYVPAERVTVADAVAQGRCDPALQDEVGWEAAHVAGDLPAPEMALAAARTAMRRAAAAERLTPDNYALLVHASVTHQGPDSWTPQHFLQAATIGGNGFAVHLRDGCQAMLAALDVAAGYLAGAPARTAALVTAADNWGHPLVDRWTCQPQTVLSDAGAAVVLSRRGGFARVRAIGGAAVPELEEMSRTEDPLFPPPVTVGAPMDLAPRHRANVGDRPFDELFWQVQRGHAELVARTLDEADTRPEDVAKVATIFTVNPTFLTEVVESLGLPAGSTAWLPEHSRGFGHAGCADPVLGLTHLVETGQVGPGDRVLLLGSTWMIARTCALVEIVRAVDW